MTRAASAHMGSPIVHKPRICNMGRVNRTKALSSPQFIRSLLLLLLACLNTAAAQTSNHTAFFCPCLDRRAISFTFAMHYIYTNTSSGAQLRAVRGAGGAGWGAAAPGIPVRAGLQRKRCVAIELCFATVQLGFGVSA
eukprot:jgi/Mesvir1/8743/Mv02666-RA.1